MLAIQLDPPPLPEGPAAVLGTRQLVDGGFEATPHAGGGASAWTLLSSSGPSNHISAMGNCPRGGQRHAYLGGKNDLDSRLSRTVSLPTSPSSAVLSLRGNVVTSEDLDEEGFDSLTIQIQNQTGSVLATPVKVQNHDVLTSNNDPGVCFQSKTVDLSPNRGQTICVDLHVETDESCPTAFRIDHMSLQVAP